VLFFPEGTRSKDKVLAGFKKGAFSVAVKAGAPVVPITLVGTGEKGGGRGEGAGLGTDQHSWELEDGQKGAGGKLGR
jgi:1-acyl-sn-glycerol-3-phosphate acyltransferase